MSKWLIIQSDGEHKGQDGWVPNWYLRECYSLQRAIIRNGGRADIWGKGHDNFNNRPNFNSYDIIFVAENYDIGWLPNLGNISGTKIHWIIDIHSIGMIPYLPISQHCDIILHATKKHIKDYEPYIPKAKHLYFPNGMDDKYFHFSPEEKTKDISFVGSRGHTRVEYLNRLEKDVNLQYFFVTGEDMIKTIRSSKIHFNKGVGDVNYRNFETIGLGTCLCTNYSDELENLGFEDGYNCLWYHDYEECVDKIRTNLANGMWHYIGLNGLKFSKKHTYTERMGKLMEQLCV